MVTYLVGTDGEEASETICDHLETELEAVDVLEVVNVLSSRANRDERQAGEEALALFEDRFDDRVTVNTRQLSRGRSPADEIAAYAEEIAADEIVVALRRHTRTERVIFGSVSHKLLQKVTRPITLVPLPQYQPVV
ncbi:universal stress protein [Salinirubellus salinus]|jgi:nucleotide-binding universal stress UspA family protein|uniref:Universal stress protein n=1 Tax=Salinirubellus salinus TaxID=1364945 RepID=A0A9E7QZD4_9EURY|nr:universal stress protein [Salinirubellus salinus]UWM52836.1 universal stress protein [Salinirubellus salinus]